MTTETDRELLELAARAAGIEYDPEKSKPHPVSGAWHGLWLVYRREPSEYDRRYWHPLTDDGDALRLMTKLNLHVTSSSTDAWVSALRITSIEPLGDDPYAATRRAITRAAAEIGREMK